MAFLNGPVNSTPLVLTSVTAQQVTTSSNGSFRAFTVTPTNGKIYWGGPGVTALNGQPIVSGATLTIMTKHPESYYLIGDTGTTDVRVTLYTGVG